MPANPNRNGEDPLRSLHERFDVAGYLDYQGEKFVQRFDANSYLVISKLMDTFDLARGYASEEEALRRITGACFSDRNFFGLAFSARGCSGPGGANRSCRG